MITTFKVLIVFLCVTPLFSQVSKKQFISQYQALQSINNYDSGFELDLTDKRVYNQNKIALAILNNHFAEKFNDLSSSNSINKLEKIKCREARVEINFFNLTESSSKKAVLKAIAEVYLKGNDCSDLDSHFSVNDEYLTDFKFKNIGSSKYASELQYIINRFSEKFVSKMYNQIEELRQLESQYVVEITAIGIAAVLNSKEEAKDAAILDALVKSGELAFGLSIMNKSEIVDYGDVSDVIKSESGGTVLDYSYDENDLVYTTDGYCCVFVKSLMKENINN